MCVIHWEAKEAMSVSLVEAWSKREKAVAISMQLESFWSCYNGRREKEWGNDKEKRQQRRVLLEQCREWNHLQRDPGMGTFHDHILHINMRTSTRPKESSEARSAIQECKTNNAKRRDSIPAVSRCCICSNRKEKKTKSKRETVHYPLVLALLWELSQKEENERMGIRTKQVICYGLNKGWVFCSQQCCCRKGTSQKPAENNI